MKKIITIITIILIIFFIREINIVDFFKNIEKLRSLINEYGVIGPLVYITLFSLITITCISVIPLTIAGGVIFGVIKGIVFTAIGSGIGLSLSFLIARYIAKDFIRNKYGQTKIFKKIDNGVKKEGWFILAITRFLPIFPFGVQNYIYGLTSINFWQYTLLSTLFVLPGISIFIIFSGAIFSGDINKAKKTLFVASIILLGTIIITRIIVKKINKKKE